MSVDDLLHPAVEVVAPSVVTAPDLAVGERAAPVGEAGAPVKAGVVEGLDGVGVGPDDEDRLVADQVLEIVAHLGRSPRSRQATCQTRGHSRSISRSANSRET